MEGGAPNAVWCPVRPARVRQKWQILEEGARGTQTQEHAPQVTPEAPARTETVLRGNGAGTAMGATPRGKRDDQEHFGVRGGHVGLCETCYGMWDYVKLERERHAHVRCDTRLTAGAG